MTLLQLVVCFPIEQTMVVYSLTPGTALLALRTILVILVIVNTVNVVHF